MVELTANYRCPPDRALSREPEDAVLHKTLSVDKWATFIAHAGN